MTTDTLDLLRAAAEWAIEHIDPEESWHASETWWAADGRVREYVAEADPHTILALIADLEAAEDAAGCQWHLRYTAEQDLADAEKLIEAQHEDIRESASKLEESKRRNDDFERSGSCMVWADIDDVLTAQTILLSALARHDEWKGGDDE